MCGFTPAQVREMSLAEAHLVIEGFTEMRRAESGVAPDNYPTQEEHDELMRWARETDG